MVRMDPLDLKAQLEQLDLKVLMVKLGLKVLRDTMAQVDQLAVLDNKAQQVL